MSVRGRHVTEVFCPHVSQASHTPLLMPTHGSPDELSSVFPPTLSFLSYNVKVKGGAESRGLREVLRVLAPSSKPNQHQTAPILPQAQFQWQRVTCSLLASTEKSAVLLGNMGTVFLESFPGKKVAYRKACLHIGLLSLPGTIACGLELLKFTSWPCPSLDAQLWTCYVFETGFASLQWGV